MSTTKPVTGAVRVNLDWLAHEIVMRGDLTAFAERIAVEPSTLSRQASGQCEVSGRFIAAALLNIPVEFDEAFVVTRDEQ